MRLLLRLALVLLGLVPWAIRAQAQGAAFSCNGTFYQVRQVTTNGVNTSYLYQVDRSSATYTTTPVNVNNGGNDLGFLLNALAYNSQDGYMYALSTPGSAGSNTNTPVYLYKIGQGGIVRVGGAITVSGTNLATTVASGTFDKIGNYYFTSQNTGGTADYGLYRIAPTSSTPTAATRVALSQNITMYDIAINPIDGFLYGSNSVGSLFKIDPNASPATLTTISTAPSQTSALAVGSVFFDVSGTLYAYSNGTVGTDNSANFYRIDTSTGVYTNISSVTPASVSDGASCINPGSSIDVTKEVTNVRSVDASTFDISYAIRVRNTYTATLSNVQVSDLLHGNVSTSTNVPFAAATTVTIVTAPAVTNYDGATLVANAAFTGLSATPTNSAVSGGSLLSGTQSLTAGQRALITYTVRVQFGSAANVPTTTANNTAYGSSTSSGPNKGYTLTSTDALLTPNALVASDASTNSASFPALITTTTNGTPDNPDTPSPTPVTFAPSISGVVFEDVNYGGGAGRSQGTSQGLGRPNARVELYGADGTYLSNTTTAANGSYSFTGLTAGASYTVRVGNTSVTSSRNTGNATGLVGVQTYRATATAADGTIPDLNRVGGEYPARVEAANGASGSTLVSLTAATGTTAAESIAAVTLSANNAPTVGISFGYNFDTVVNTNNTGQGSLRQFITNANALDNTGLAQGPASTGGPTPAPGTETSIFMISDGVAHQGLAAYNATTSPGLASQLTNGVAVITSTTALPAIGGTYGAYTTISGETQTQNVGDTNSAILGGGGTVGVGSTTLDHVNGPEVQLTGSTNMPIGLDVASTGTFTTIQGLAVVGFGNALNDNANANIRSAANNLTVTQTVLGSGATTFAQPTTPTNADNLRLTAGTTGISITNNLIGYSNGKGITVGPTVTNASITNNEVRNNGLGNTNFDGIDVQGSSAIIMGNMLTSNAGQGVDTYRSAGSNAISGNTINNNGRGTTNLAPTETPGVRLYGASNTVSQNIINSNYGAGILLEGVTNSGNTAAASNTTISQNSIFNNGNLTARNGTAATGQLGIDLAANGDNESAGTSPYVTLNSATTTGANGLLNFPVLTSATVVGTNLVLKGYAKPNAAIELFIAQVNTAAAGTTSNNFGQGRTYLTTLTAGSTGGASYSGTINGFNQGSDTNANAFTFTVPLTAAQQALVTAGVKLTATSTLGRATSEFSGITNVNAAPVPNTLTNANILNTSGATTLSPNLSATANGTANGAANSISYYTLTSLPSSGTLRYNNTVLTNANIATTQILPAQLNNLTYTPVAGFSGNVSFTYTATDANGVTSTTSNNGGTVATGDATYTIPVGIADVTVSLSGQTTLNAGQPTSSFTAIFTNEGPGTANGVTRQVMLPAGAIVTGSQQATILSAYSDAQFTTNGSVTTIDFGTAPSLASAASNTVSFVFTAPTTTGTATLTGTTSTTNSEGANLAPNQSTLTLNTIGAADVTAAITASANATTGTLNVTFGNIGAQSAANVTRTVQLPAGLTNVTVTTSGSGETGTYNATTGLVTYLVTGTSTPSAPTLAASNTLTSTITYAITSGAAPVTATANVSTTTNEGGLTSNNAATTTMASAFDLTTTLTGPTSALTGSPTTLFVTTTNNGPNTAPVATQTVIIPSKAALTNVFTTNGGMYSYNTVTAAGTVVFPDLANVPSGQTVTNSVSFNAPADPYNPSATVSTTAAGETNTNNNTANLNGSATNTGGTSYVVVKVTTTATANEAVTIVADATVVSAGTAVTYTVTATNNGPNATTDVIARVQLIPGLTAANLKVDNTTGTLTNGVISFMTTAGTTTYNTTTGILTYPTLVPAASNTSQASGRTIPFEKLTITMPTTVGNDGQLLATATVTSALSDPVPADNVASVVVKVTTTADLATTISGPSSAVAGTTTSYTATFTNNGAGTATSVVETVQLPTGLTNVVVTNSSNTVVTNAYNSTTGIVTLPTVVSDAVGTTQSYTIAFPAPGQSYVVSSSVSSGSSDNVGANNAATQSTTVSANSDVAINVNGPATAVIGNPVTYAVTATNNGPTAATSVASTLQLPSGLNNVVVQGADGTTISNAYNATSGLVTFPSFSLAAGDSQLGLVSFTMPNPSNGYVTGAAAVSTSTDAVSSNNTSSVTTSVSGTTTDAPDLATTITTTATSPAVAASSVTFTMSFVNNSTTTAASAVAPVAYLPAGLSSVIIRNAANTVITNAYNSVTGQVTFPVIGSQAAGNTTAYTVTLTAPSNGTLAVASAVSSSNTDPTPANNYAIRSLTITPAYDAVTTLTGPPTAWPGSNNVYTVTTTNNGPSTATASTTQTVTVPAGVTATNISGSGTQSGTTISFPAISSQAAGTNGEVVNTFTIAMPASGSIVLMATVASANESNKNNNQAAFTTNQANQAPVAQNVWNTLQSARGNTAVAGLAISPLNATDADGTIKNYTVVTLPSSAQGFLFYNGAAVAIGQPVAASGLTFLPTAGYVGNATFTYTATDNGGAVSNTALYTLPVAQDQSTTYSIYNTSKGGSNPYLNNDVLAQTIDPNTVLYNSSGLVYNATTGALLSGAANGLATTGTNAVLASGSTLPSGVSLNPATGTIYVSNASSLPRSSTDNPYTVNVTTTDLNGGTNTVPVTFTIGANATPLPVVLTEFTAAAVLNRDALLNWRTASEQYNDHFEVERSFDGTSFAPIGQVAGHGTTSAASAYSLTDAGVATKATGPVYYRLRQVDLDGTATYSPVRTVSFAKVVLAKLSLFPNPVQDRTTLDLGALPASANYQAQLLDATGRQVRAWTLAGGVAQPLAVAELASGSYLLVVTGQQPDGSLLKQTLRLTKE